MSGCHSSGGSVTVGGRSRHPTAHLGACRPSHRLLFVEVGDGGEVGERIGAEWAALGEGAPRPNEDVCAFHALTPFTLWPQLPAIP